MLHLSHWLAVVCGLLAAGGIGYYGLGLWSAYSFRRDWQRRSAADFTPPVSLLKPLRGADPGMYEAFRSHCLQDYPEFELIFGVADAGDPAVALVERLQREFSTHHIELVICPAALGANLKVSNLVQMLPRTNHPYLLVNDGDITIEPDYLRRILAPFANPKVGMVTSLYRGEPGRTLGSRLEALGISTDFCAGVLVARQLEGVQFGLGATLALPRSALDQIGGFAPLLEYLADDYELGNRVAKLGREVVISDAVVATRLPDYTLGGYWQHQLRWARGIREVRRLGYLGLAFTFGLPWAIFALLFSGGSAWSAWLLAIALLARLAVAVAVGRQIVNDPRIPADLWLLPLRDVLALILWGATFAGRTIVWRGSRFVLRDGKLKPLPSKQDTEAD